MCHNPSKPRNPANFLKAQTAKDMEADRGLWHNVAAQLRNRTMPPIASKLTEDDRLRVASWIDNQLRQTACSGGDYAGASSFRRLNRREYHNTIRDLLGVDFDVSLVFPADGTGGSGFDTNGDTLYVPPVLMERYLSAAQQILDRVIITPPLARAFTPGPVAAGAPYAMAVPVYLDGDYTVVASQEGTETPANLILKVDGVVAGPLRGRNNNGGPVTRKSALTKATLARNLSRIQVRLTRGDHTLEIGAGDVAAHITTLTIDQVPRFRRRRSGPCITACWVPSREKRRCSRGRPLARCWHRSCREPSAAPSNPQRSINSWCCSIVRHSAAIPTPRA